MDYSPLTPLSVNATVERSLTNIEVDILVTCTGLNDCKKVDVNGKQENILAIIHIENIPNWNQLKSTSSWVNIDLTDYLEIQSVVNISFNFITSSIYDISKFDITFKNGKGEAITFDEKEKKIPQVNFSIDAIDGEQQCGHNFCIAYKFIG